MISRLFVAAAGIGTVAIGAATLAAPAPGGDAVKGKTIFARCAACHSLAPTGVSGLGPNLVGVVGRRAGTLAGYRYSPAMQKSGLKWDEPTLSRYLSGPAKTVPGTKMMAAPITNPQDRADVIAFLKSNGAKK
jgi:cytochrome c